MPGVQNGSPAVAFLAECTKCLDLRNRFSNMDKPGRYVDSRSQNFRIMVDRPIRSIRPKNTKMTTPKETTMPIIGPLYFEAHHTLTGAVHIATRTWNDFRRRKGHIKTTSGVVARVLLLNQPGNVYSEGTTSAKNAKEQRPIDL